MADCRRRSARGKKAATLKTIYSGNPAVEVFEISDIIHELFPEALQGVDAVIHAASPLPGRMEPEQMLNVRCLLVRYPVQTLADDEGRPRLRVL